LQFVEPAEDLIQRVDESLEVEHGRGDGGQLASPSRKSRPPIRTAAASGTTYPNSVAPKKTMRDRVLYCSAANESCTPARRTRDRSRANPKASTVRAPSTVSRTVPVMSE